ncbi:MULTISPECIES: PAS domain-containing protein [Methylobacterium]|uniref:PAS domain-containing protein n=1 Tax=Methylobacterium TaxID=407 RepID=UPI001FEF7DD6|nr:MULTISPECIES: PAS domain-containing protein [unclassified Methylobacterium]
MRLYNWVAEQRKVVILVSAQAAENSGWRMPRRLSDDTLFSASLPLTNLNIGLWEDDVDNDCIRGDAVFARIYGLLDAETTQGISWSRLVSIFHPEDLALDTVRRRRVREEGGLFVWEHRIIPVPGVVRWVLARGHFERSLDGGMRGRGILIDVTDSRTEGYVDGPSRFLGVPEATLSPAERMAERALELWELRDELSADSAARLQPLIHALMFELGREIAASLPEGRATAAPNRGGSKVH